MTHRLRHDEPGAWHHVMNRGVAKSPMFESSREARYFLAQLARAVRRGQIEVIAYCVMTTHFHVLVVSKTGTLSDAFKRVESPYAKQFNRRRGRDGSLVRGRFHSKRVRSDAYRETAIAYIDRNPADAAIVPHGAAYPFGSAYHYTRSSGPIWMSRAWVEARVRASAPSGRFDAEAYVRHYARGVSPARLRWIEAQLRSPDADSRIVDRFMKNVPGRVLRYLRARARLADGTGRPAVLVDVESLTENLDAVRAAGGPLSTSRRGHLRDGWCVMRVGLLRDLCGLTFREIALRVGWSQPSAVRAYDAHKELVLAHPGYAASIERVSEAALAACHRAG